MLNLTDKCEEAIVTRKKHTFRVLELVPAEYDSLIAGLVNVLPDYYVAPESIAKTLELLGKTAAAEKLRIKIPEACKIRSGDIGEVLTTDFIEEATKYSVPIKKLRWRDHRDMAMRGDDVIGILINQKKQTISFLKAEAKSYKSLSRAVIQKAREELDLDGGLPAPHALAFIAERLREMGNSDTADLIEKVQLIDGIKPNQVEHLLFTFTASNPASLQKEDFDAYDGRITQSSVGLRVKKHQELISNVYHEVIDGLND